MPTIVKNIVVNFEDCNTTCTDERYGVGNFLQLPLGQTSKKFPTHSMVRIINPVLKDYFNAGKASFFGTIAIKRQIAIPKFNEKTNQYDMGEYPDIRQQKLIFKNIMIELVDRNIIKDFYCVFEFHSCMKWLHIHFLCNIRGNDENYQKKIKKMYSVIRKILEEDYVLHENMYRFKKYLNISRCRNTERCYKYMDKYEELTKHIEWLKPLIYIYNGKRNGVKKIYRNF